MEGNTMSEVAKLTAKKKSTVNLVVSLIVTILNSFMQQNQSKNFKIFMLKYTEHIFRSIIFGLNGTLFARIE